MGVIIGREKMYSKENLLMWPLTEKMKSLVGNKYSRLLVLHIGWKRHQCPKTRYYISCLCDCGEECIVSVEKIESGKTQSCGCLHTENLLKAVTKHGESNWGCKNGKSNNFSVVYSKWQSVKARCLYPSTEGYEHYGAVGITICEGYFGSYELFRDDLGKQPSPEYTLDRINTHGSYSCGRCTQCKEKGWGMNIRWADEETQNNNKRNSVWIDYKGERLTATQWGRKLGVKGSTVASRIRNGWSAEDAITIPVGAMLGGSRKSMKK